MHGKMSENENSSSTNKTLRKRRKRDKVYRLLHPHLHHLPDPPLLCLWELPTSSRVPWTEPARCDASCPPGGGRSSWGGTQTWRTCCRGGRRSRPAPPTRQPGGHHPNHLVVAGPACPQGSLVTQVEVPSVKWLMPWSTTVPARALVFLLYLLVSEGKNLGISWCLFLAIAETISEHLDLFLLPSKFWWHSFCPWWPPCCSLSPCNSLDLQSLKSLPSNPSTPSPYPSLRCPLPCAWHCVGVTALCCGQIRILIFSLPSPVTAPSSTVCQPGSF